MILPSKMEFPPRKTSTSPLAVELEEWPFHSFTPGVCVKTTVTLCSHSQIYMKSLSPQLPLLTDNVEITRGIG